MIIAIDISVLIESRRTGVTVYTYRLIEALLKNNHEDKYILFGLAPLAKYNELKNIEFKNYPNVELKIFKMPARLFRRVFLIWQKLNWPKIENLIGPVDVVHSFNWWLPPTNAKSVSTLFDITAIDHPEWHQDRTSQLDQVRLNRIKKFADLVLTISENSKRDFLKYNSKIKTDVIYPATDARFEQRISKDKLNKILAKYQIKPGYILSVGTIEPRKNLDRLIKAYIASGVIEQLVLVGLSGWKNQSILELVKQHQDRIVLTGFIPDEDLPAIYQGAKIFVYPSLYEGFGIPVLEAMVSRVPVISASNSSLPEVGGKSVVYINAENENQISQAISQLLKSKNNQQQIKSQLKYAARFSWDESAEKLTQAYHKLK